MGDNYAEKQNTKQTGKHNPVHNPKPNGFSKCRTIRVDNQNCGVDERSKAANKTRFWNEVLGEAFKKIYKGGK